MNPIEIDEQLRLAYEMAEYQLLNPRLSIYIGQRSAQLQKLQLKLGVKSTTIVTAFNPQSAHLSDAENNRQQNILHQQLEQLKHTYRHGLNLDPQAIWPPEPSYWVFGLSPTKAVDLGRLFGQKAIVYIDAKGIPVLHWCL